MSCSGTKLTDKNVKRSCQRVHSEKLEKVSKHPRLSDNSRSDIVHSLPISHTNELTPNSVSNGLDDTHSPLAGSIDRLAQLSALIDQCSHGELLHIKNTIKPLLKRDFIAHLPVEISLRILKYLSPRDVFHCTQVSQSWLHVCSDNLLWYYLCVSSGLCSSLCLKSMIEYHPAIRCNNCPLCTNKSVISAYNDAKYRIDNVVASNSDVVSSDGVEEKNTSEGVKKYVSNVSVKSDHIQLNDESTSFSSSNVSSSKCSLINKVNWKSFYRQDLHTQCNWRNGGPWQPIVAPAHHNHVITCLEVYEEWAITGSDDSSICVWNINTGQCLINLFGHLGGVWSMTVIPSQFYPAKKDYHPFSQYPLLISGSCDRTARVWQLDGHRWPCIATLFGHQSTIRCLASQKPCSAPKFVLNNTHSCNCNVSGNNPSTLGPDMCSNDNSGDAIDNFNIIGDNISEKEYILSNISANKGNDGNDNGHHYDNAYGNINVNLMNNNSESNKPDAGEQIFKQETFENSHLVVTGSRDTTLRLWNVLTGECVQEFRGHRGAIRCVQFTGDQIVSGSYDCTIRLWCALQGHCLRVFSAHTNRVYTLLFDGYHIISGSLDTTIRIWNVQTGQLEQTFYGHRSLTSELAFGSEQNILVSSNADETIRVWHIHTGKCIHILAGPHKHQSAVTCVQLTRNFIISSGDDGTVKLWDKRSGAYIRDLLRLDGAGRGGVIWRIVASEERLICAAGSRIGMEPTKLVILRFQEPQICSKHSKNKAYTINHICRPRQKYAPEPRLSQILCTNPSRN